MVVFIETMRWCIAVRLKVFVKKSFMCRLKQFIMNLSDAV